MPFQVFLMDSPALVKKLGFDLTPQTLVIGPGGKVERNWPGAFQGGAHDEIEHFFGTKLPGLKNTSVTQWKE